MKALVAVLQNFALAFGKLRTRWSIDQCVFVSFERKILSTRRSKRFLARK